MTKSIVVTSLKGGIGKSTLAANIAANFAFKQYKVLAVDDDAPQWRLKELTKNAPLEAITAREFRKGQFEVENPDYLVIDQSYHQWDHDNTFHNLTDGLIIPVSLDMFLSDGMKQFYEKLQYRYGELPPTVLVLNYLNSRLKHAKEFTTNGKFDGNIIRERLKEYFNPALIMGVRDSADVRNSQATGLTLFEYVDSRNESDSAFEDTLRLCNALDKIVTDNETPITKRYTTMKRGRLVKYASIAAMLSLLFVPESEAPTEIVEVPPPAPIMLDPYEVMSHDLRRQKVFSVDFAKDKFWDVAEYHLVRFTGKRQTPHETNRYMRAVLNMNNIPFSILRNNIIVHGDSVQDVLFPAPDSLKNMVNNYVPQLDVFSSHRQYVDNVNAIMWLGDMIKSPLATWTSPVGPRSGAERGGGSAYHAAFDFSAEMGSPIVTPFAGRGFVWKGGGKYGNRIWIMDEDVRKGFRIAHVSDFSREPDRFRKNRWYDVGLFAAGDTIAFVGNSGRNGKVEYPPHAHIEVLEEAPVRRRGNIHFKGRQYQLTTPTDLYFRYGN